MEPFKYHVFVCGQQKADNIPSCSARGSGKVLDALRQGIARNGLQDKVLLTQCGSIGLCERGPNMVVYPEGAWYSGVSEEDVPEIIESHFRKGIVVQRLARQDVQEVRSEICGNRDRFLASMKAKDAAGALPDEFMQTVRGFQESRIILTAIELDLFSAVGAGATAGTVAASRGTDPRATELLLNASVAMGLLSKSAGTFRNSPLSSRYLVAGSPDDSRSALTHWLHLWDRWSTLTECIRTGTRAEGAQIEEEDDSWTEAFIAAMHKLASERGPMLIRALGLQGVGRMLDLGGGSGAAAISFARASETLHVVLLDLPEVIGLARGYIEKAGLSDRISTQAGDMLADPLGENYDLILVSQICHMFSPEENGRVLERCFDALAPGGRLAILDFILSADRTAPKSGALFALNMLVGTPAGRSYSAEEYCAWLGRTGFTGAHHIQLPGPAGLIVATRP